MLLAKKAAVLLALGAVLAGVHLSIATAAEDTGRVRIAQAQKSDQLQIAPGQGKLDEKLGSKPQDDGRAKDGKTDQPATPAGNTDGGGRLRGPVPDAVTILDILRRLPDVPGRGGGRPVRDPAAELDLPTPQSTGTPLPSPKPRPKRVVTLTPKQTFIPRPSPRPQGTPPVATGAIVPQVRDKQVVVTLTNTSDANTVFELGQDMGLDGQTLYVSNLLGARLVRYTVPDARSVADVLAQLATDVRVLDAQPDYVFATSDNATRPASLPVPQYAPAKIHLAEAHRIAEGSKVRIAVIDTAIEASHPALQGAVTDSYDALGGSKAIAEAHGTAIAGIVGARTGLVGVAPEASVLAVRAFASEAGGAPQSDTMALLRALDWAALNGARVVNMSFAGPEDPLLGKAINAAISQGLVVVAAAGNGGPSAKPAFPAAFPNVIAVSATDSSDALYKDANRGSYVAVAAPGVDIISAAPGGAYDVSSGTSMAAAHVSGIAALMLEKNPKLSPADVRAKIASSARKLGGASRDEVGAGMVDASGALR